MQTYHLTVFEAEEGGFWGEVVELPGCVAQGETMDALMDSARGAIIDFLEAMAEQGEEPTHDRFVASVEVATV